LRPTESSPVLKDVDESNALTSTGGNFSIHSHILRKKGWANKMKDEEMDDKFHEEVDDRFYDMSVNLSRHNLEVTLKRTKEQCFRAAKEIGSESFDGFKKMDAFVRSQYADEPKKMAEWDEIMQRYEFSDEEDEVEE